LTEQFCTLYLIYDDDSETEEVNHIKVLKLQICLINFEVLKGCMHWESEQDYFACLNNVLAEVKKHLKGQCHKKVSQKIY
jgi:hypothetical protein